MNNEFVNDAKLVFDTEIRALSDISSRLGPEFDFAVKAILSTVGRVVVCGMGKSGLVGKKIAASFASTGTYSFFLHPAEAIHGDLGMVKSEDLMILISYSGETEELIKILPFFKENKNYIISITGNKESTLAKAADVSLDVYVRDEACPIKVAPTTSTTATIVMGDALVISVMKFKNFKEEDFAILHPGGNLGKRLLSKVEEFTITKDLPFLNIEETLSQNIKIIDDRGLGIGFVKNAQDQWCVLTDGDVRRALVKFGSDALNNQIHNYVTESPKGIKHDQSMHSALKLMDACEITSLLVFKDEQLLGILKK